MTKINKPVKRMSSRATSHRGRRIVVMIEPGDVISFREERTKTWFSLPIEACYELAVQAEVKAKAREKRLAAKAKKKGRTG